MSIFSKDIEYLKKDGSWQQKMGTKIAKLGIVPLPFAVIKYKRFLKLTASDIILIGLIYKFKQGFDWPYFSLAKITRDGGFCQDTLHNAKKRLIEKRYLRIIPKKENPKGKGRNIYDLTGLQTAIEMIIDANPETAFGIKYLNNKDHLDYVFLKELEKEKKSENQRVKDSNIGEDNK